MRALTDVMLVVDCTGGAKGLDNQWDPTQKRFFGLLSLGRLSSNPIERDAADRLHSKMLLGRSGEGHTRLSYQQEVDFGRNQIRLANETQAADDITLLGLGNVITQIATATENIALAIGQGRADQVPTKQRKAVVAECVHTFGTVHRALDWLARYGDAADQSRAVALCTTLAPVSRT